MKLYFVRHASASDVAARDEERELTSQGQEEARIAGRALARLGAAPAKVFSSPLLRARQTASVMSQAAGFPEPATLPELQNDATTDGLLRVLPEAPEILLVGHMPSLAEHLAALTNEVASKCAMAKASIAAVELPQLKIATGQLLWIKRQAQLRALL